MGLNDHYTGGRVERRSGQIVTVDVANRQIQFVANDAAVISVGITNIPTIFRWPIEGEHWTFVRENGQWRLESRLEGPEETLPLTQVSPGTVRIDGTTVLDSNGDSIRTPTIWGRVSSTGSLLGGASGVTASRVSTGEYDITFSSAYSNLNAVAMLVTCVSPNIIASANFGSSNTVCRVSLRTGSGSASNSDFTFAAIG